MESRRPLAGVAVLFFVNGTAFGSWLPRLPELRDRLGLSLSAVGLVLAMAGIGGLAGSASSGRLVGRLGARRVGLWPALALMATLPLIGIAPGAVALGAVVLAAAAADALADVGMNALAVRAQETRPRSIFNRLHALWSMGSLTGAAVAAGAAAVRFPLPWHLLAVAGAGTGAVMWARTVLPATELRPRMRSRPGLAVGVVVVGAGAALVEGAPHEWSAIFLADVLGASAGVAGLGFLGLSAGMVAGRLLGDRAVDRLGPVRSIFTGLATVAVATIAVVTSPPVAITLAALVLWGLGVSVVLPLLYRLAGSHRGFGEGSGLAALTVGSRLGFMAGPTAVGSTAAVWSLPAGLGIVVAAGLVVTVAAVSRGLAE
ncbi:MAG: hypothetical protein ACLFWM_02665 [Actinomycetota bacterium]